MICDHRLYFAQPEYYSSATHKLGNANYARWPTQSQWAHRGPHCNIAH